MTDKISINKEGFEAEGLFSAVKDSPYYNLLIVVGGFTIIGILYMIMRCCKSESSQIIEGGKGGKNARITQHNQRDSFLNNHYQRITNRDVDSGEHITQRLIR